MRRFLGLALLALSISIATPARADIVAVSSITTPSSDGTQVRMGHWLADKFITGSNLNLLTLEAIKIQFVASSGTGGYFVDIYTDNSGVPGSLFAALTGSTNPNTAGIFTYTPSGTVTLAASTTYWMVEGSTTSTANYQPTYITTPNPFVKNGWTITGNYTFTTNSGSSWGGGASDGPTQYSIVVVPEPATFAGIAGVAGLGAAGYLRRRRGTA
ncbi:MAG TPA: choice-of-anchor R domain-containing protein [Opitutales bacterium]|nr:choice-of-anchor R domain-containing protein [Opitutales bacterium]